METKHTHHHGHKCCEPAQEHSHDHSHDHDHDHGDASSLKAYLPGLFSLALLLTGILLDYYVKPSFFQGVVRLVWYIAAYLPVGYPVIKEAVSAIAKGDFFNEFTLMVLATLGAFGIGEYPEAVAVMLFYAVGELFQGAAVQKSKNNIKALLDVRPASASLLVGETFESVNPATVNPGDIIQVKAGEKVPLDGEMLSNGSSFNTSALTGESKPQSIYKGEPVLAGMMNMDKVVEIKVSRIFADSSLARILDMVQNAVTKKARTEILIRRFAKVYTPVVFFLALAIVIFPFFFTDNYVFRDWLYRGLVFLVISCPCALVISIPLGYFGGIGAASRNGILFKGSNFLDLMTKVNTIVMDKTGTLTKGIFKVQEIVQAPGAFPDLSEQEFLQMAAALERKSNHPVAKAIAAYAENSIALYEVSDVQEIAGHGLEGILRPTSDNGQLQAGIPILAGNSRLLKSKQIAYDKSIDERPESIIAVALDGKFAGYIVIADELKEGVSATIRSMRFNGIRHTVMLSGDKHAIVQKTASAVGIDAAFGDLLPEDKVSRLETLKNDPEKVIAFVGDGINDAPVLALSDVGIAMGAMGSDAAIEIADVVIQTDEPSKVVTAIKIGHATKNIVIQNIGLAFVVKAIVLLLGAGGLATMWEAVFADVGVALLAILNAVRIQNMTFEPVNKS